MYESGQGFSHSNKRNARILLPAAATVCCLILFACLALSLNAGPGQAFGENTTGTYTLSNGDTIQFCTTNQCTGGGNQFTNTFAPGATIFVKVHTTRVNGGTGYLYLYRSNVNAVPPATGYSARNLAWTQIGQDYYSSVQIPGGTANHLRIYGQIINGGNRVAFEDEIMLTTQPNRFMNFYWTGPQAYPPNPAAESYTFRSGSTVYVMGYGSGTNRSATYTTNTLKDIVTGGTTALTMGGYSRTSTYYHRYTLALPATGLTDGQWYSVNSRLMRSSTGLIYNMSRMILIDDSAPLAAIDAPADDAWISGIVPINGTADDLYSYYSYVLEYGAGATPSSWTTISSAANGPPIDAGLIANWDTTFLSGLFTLRLTVTDRAGNPGNQTVVTRQVNVDNTAPAISGVGVNPLHSTSATVNWTTDEVSSSQVRYGTSPGVYTDQTTLDPAMVVSHTQPLGSLQPATTYYYQVISSDRAGNSATSPESSFLTPNLTVLQPFAAVGKDTEYVSRQPAWDWGAADWLVAGDLDNPDYGTGRSVMSFDLTGIPATATVSSATMSLYQQWQGDTSTPSINAHYLTRDWTEGTGTGLGAVTSDGANWSTYDGTNSWTSPGGDYYASPSSTAAAASTIDSWVDWDLTALTQSWIDGGIVNNGLLLKQDTEDPAGFDAKGFWSSDYGDDPSLRPKLAIEWFGEDTAPPITGEIRAENITRTSADIKWSTDETADSQVEYGTTTSYGSTVPASPDPALVNQHTVALPGLSEDTVYHYRVISSDSSGNQTISDDHAFQTARVIIIQPDAASGQDAWITSAGATLNYGSASDMVVGNNTTGAANNRGLLKFDLAAIPSASTINSATLSIYQHAQSNSQTPMLGLYSVQRSWLEGTGSGSATADGATWLTHDGASAWSTAGGDFGAGVQAASQAPDSTAAWVDFTVPALVQGWVNGTVANHGVAIKKTVEDAGLTDDKAFHSSDYTTDPSLRPKLVVEYVPAPGSISITIDETYNRDASPGTGSVGFGSVNPANTYEVGGTASPQYAVKLTVKANGMWGLRVAAAGDLVQSNPLNYIDIADLLWKEDAELPAAYRSMTSAPSETTVATGQGATNGQSFFFDYRLAVPAMAVSGNYSAPVIYTAYPE